MATNTCAAINTFSRMLVQGGVLPRTFNGSSPRLDYVVENLESDRQLQGGNSITGDSAPYDSGVRPHSYIPGGMIYFQNGPSSWTRWLELIFGGTLSGTNIPLDPILPSVDVLLDRENGIFRYNEVYAAQAVIRGSTANGGEDAEMIDMIVNTICKGEAINGESFPASPASVDNAATNAPYIFAEASLLFDGAAYGFDSFNLSINNKIIAPTRNSLTPNCIRSAGRDIGLQVRMPFLTTSLADALQANIGPSVAAQITFTNGGMSTTFLLPAVRNRFKTPTARGKTEIPLNLDLTAYRTGAANQIVITHDATP